MPFGKMAKTEVLEVVDHHPKAWVQWAQLEVTSQSKIVVVNCYYFDVSLILRVFYFSLETKFSLWARLNEGIRL